METKPKKSLGQNFLKDPKILKKIADFAQIKKEDTVVEVGPGEGTLTKFLLEQAKKVVAIEKDEALAQALREKFREEIENERLEIIEGDIMDSGQKLLERTSAAERSEARTSEWKEFLPAQYKLVGNIPYYITGALFKKFLSETNKQPESITFVVQKEVADRIIGSHSAKASRDKKESILSISIKAYGEPAYGGIIKAGSFFPKPKVDSAIISVRNISKKRFGEITPPTPSYIKRGQDQRTPPHTPLAKGRENPKTFEKKFFKILKAGFAHKRKFLIKNLGGVSKVPFDTLASIFKKCGISEKARAEDLEVNDWFRLAEELFGLV